MARENLGYEAHWLTSVDSPSSVELSSMSLEPIKSQFFWRTKCISTRSTAIKHICLHFLELVALLLHLG